MNPIARRLLTVCAVLCAVSPMAMTVASADTFTDAETCSMVERTDGNFNYSCDDSVEADISAGRTLATTVFTQTNYAGKKLRIYKLGGDCTTTYSDVEVVGSFPVAIGSWPNWQNNVASLHTFNHCDIKLFRDPYPDNNPASVWIDDSSDLNTLTLDWSNKANWFHIS
jgi:hypothetical protein